MTLQGENRRLVVMGLEALRQPQRLGLRALIHACGCDEQEITAGTIGYILAPRVNAAGRMEQAELAVRLFLTQDPQEADRLAETLCRLNRERQTIESEIYSEAVSRLHGAPDGAIVLAGEHWHQGVVGIVASRLSEEFCRPTFLICLDGERGKASSRSYGGFNLFASLTELSGLLEGYGGHELAAGFTIARKNIDAFRAAMCRCAAAYAASAPVEATLQVDCEIEASLLTEENVRGLSQLEPCGAGCPKPVLSLSGLTVEHAMAVGSGKHLRLQLCRAPGRHQTCAVPFSSRPARLSGKAPSPAIPGRRQPLRRRSTNSAAVRTVQLNLIDLPARQSEADEALVTGLPASHAGASASRRTKLRVCWPRTARTSSACGTISSRRAGPRRRGAAGQYRRASACRSRRPLPGAAGGMRRVHCLPGRSLAELGLDRLCGAAGQAPSPVAHRGRTGRTPIWTNSVHVLHAPQRCKAGDTTWKPFRNTISA